MPRCHYKKYLEGERSRWKGRISRCKKNNLQWLNWDEKTGAVKTLPQQITVIGEDGIGDEIFYLQFARALAKKCRQVKWIHRWPDGADVKGDNSKLLPLFKKSFANQSNFLFESFKAGVTTFPDQVVFSKELIKYFGRNEKEWLKNSCVPYITTCPDRTDTLKKSYSKDGKAIIGLAWRGAGGKKGKDCPLMNPGWKTVFTQEIKEKCSFVSLQYGDPSHDIEHARNAYKVEIQQDSTINIKQDLEGAASQIAACDFVISISTTTAHLAGALCKKTLLLLSDDPIVHWEFPAAYPSVTRINSLSIEEVGKRLHEIL